MGEDRPIFQNVQELVVSELHDAELKVDLNLNLLLLQLG